MQLYHLGLGAGTDPMDRRELRYLVDGTPQVLPTFGNVAQSFHMTEPPSVQFPGIDIELSRVLHASEAVSVPAPIPPSGTGVAVTRFTDIWDKGKAAVIWSETTVTTPDGTPLWTQKRSIFARGEGGFGGERGPSTSSAPPDRAPDLELDIPTLPQQALLYRMCGDRNPLHSDPEFAAAAGFPQPILHGLCTYGMTCKAMVDALLDGDTSRVASYGARFAGRGVPRRDAEGQHLERRRRLSGRRHCARARRCSCAGRRGVDAGLGALTTGAARAAGTGRASPGDGTQEDSTPARMVLRIIARRLSRSGFRPDLSTC